VKRVDFAPGVGGAFDFRKRGIQVVQVGEYRLVVRSKAVLFLSGHGLQLTAVNDIPSPTTPSSSSFSAQFKTTVRTASTIFTTAVWETNRNTSVGNRDCC
jgi:hypothetical protein